VLSVSIFVFEISLFTSRNYRLFSIHYQTFAWLWAFSGWLCFLLGNYFDYHMLQLLEHMGMQKTEDLDNDTNNHNHQNGNEADPLLSPPSSSSSKALPLWTRIDLQDYVVNRRPILVKWFVSSKLNPTRQDSLYWMERKGPQLYLFLFQVQLIFTAAYVSLLALSFYPFMIWKSEHTTGMECVVYLIVSVLPVYFLLSKYQVAAANLTMATSVGVHRRPNAVSQTIRDEKTSRMIRALVTMQRLRQQTSEGGFTQHGHVGDSSHNGNGNDNGNDSDHNISTLELEEVEMTFDALDKSGDGVIESSELGEVLSVLGAPATDDSLQAMMQVLDRNGDGEISKDEFVQFYKEHIMAKERLNAHSIHHMAKNLFQQLDTDASGEITLSEFTRVLQSFDVGFTMDEIGDIVNELDEQDNGTIGEHEFAHLLRNHRHLFEPTTLPR
jgi:Ca2+-binding EF-hand superfamily protein